MDIVITGRHTEVPDRFRRLVEEKLAKIGQLALEVDLVGDRADEFVDRRGRRPGQLLGGFRIEVLGIFIDDIKNRTAGNLLAVFERNLDGSFEQGVGER